MDTSQRRPHLFFGAQRDKVAISKATFAPKCHDRSQVMGVAHAKRRCRAQLNRFNSVSVSPHSTLSTIKCIGTVCVAIWHRMVPAASNPSYNKLLSPPFADRPSTGTSCLREKKTLRRSEYRSGFDNARGVYRRDWTCPPPITDDADQSETP